MGSCSYENDMKFDDFPGGELKLEREKNTCAFRTSERTLHGTRSKIICKLYIMSERNNIASTNDDREREVDVQHTSDEYKCFVGGIGYVLDDKGLKEGPCRISRFDVVISLPEHTTTTTMINMQNFPNLVQLKQQSWSISSRERVEALGL